MDCEDPFYSSDLKNIKEFPFDRNNSFPSSNNSLSFFFFHFPFSCFKLKRIKVIPKVVLRKKNHSKIISCNPINKGIQNKIPYIKYIQFLLFNCHKNHKKYFKRKSGGLVWYWKYNTYKCSVLFIFL